MNLDDNNKIIRQGMPEPTPMQQAEYYRLYGEIEASFEQQPFMPHQPKSRLIHAEVARRMGLTPQPKPGEKT